MLTDSLFGHAVFMHAAVYTKLGRSPASNCIRHGAALSATPQDERISAPMGETTVRPSIVGFVDCADWNEIGGWCFDPVLPNVPLVIEIVHDTQVICRIEANKFRADLVEVGAGTGHHGFSIRLPHRLFETLRVHLRVRVAGRDIDLEGSPIVLENAEALLGHETQRLLTNAVSHAAENAADTKELVELARFFLVQFDRVEAALRDREASAAARQERLAELASGEPSLSHRLSGLVEAAIQSHGHLDWPSSDAPEVSIIIPVFNNFDYTCRCLESMLRYPSVAKAEIILVDDGSTDATLLAGRIFGGVRIIRNAGNLGFVGSVNAGAVVARGHHLLFLNNDTEVQAGWLDELLETFTRDPRIGVVGSKLLSTDGTLQEVGGIVWRMGDAMNYGGRQDPERPEYCFLRDCDYVSGAALMIPRDLFETLGGFSSDFAPGYYEDTDLCFRVREAGRRVVVQPASRVLHHQGVTSGVDVAGPGMKRYQRIHQRRFLERWRHVLQYHQDRSDPPHKDSERHVTKRALFIDSSVPTPDQDAGSNAAFEHILSLMRLGYKVAFVGADNMARIPPYTDALQRIGVQCYYHPYFSSVEEILRRDPAHYDVVYLHRMVNAVKYTALVKERYPGCRVIYSVADLHYLRTERQAVVESAEGLRAKAASIKLLEIGAMKAADGVIVHSSAEALALAQETAGAVRASVVPWVVRVGPRPLPFAERRHILFVGGYNHQPNVDAATWLVHEIMPLVWQLDPEITCLLAGSAMPPAIEALRRRGILPIGHVADLGSLLQRTRLTVAPLRFGAGLKGKVLTSMAAALPCIATACAIEGMHLPLALEALTLADGAGAFASKIVELYHDAKRNAEAAALGVTLVGERFSERAIDAGIGQVLKPALPAPAILLSADGPTEDQTPAEATALPKGQIGAEPLLVRDIEVKGAMVGSDCTAEVVALAEPEVLSGNLRVVSVAAVPAELDGTVLIGSPELPAPSELPVELARASGDEAQAASSSSAAPAVTGAIGTTAAVWEAPD
jgi:GT2 family glycosyltransferase